MTQMRFKRSHELHEFHERPTMAVFMNFVQSVAAFSPVPPCR